MQKIESFYEVLNSLKQGDVLTSNGKDFFVFKTIRYIIITMVQDIA